MRRGTALLVLWCVAVAVSALVLLGCITGCEADVLPATADLAAVDAAVPFIGDCSIINGQRVCMDFGAAPWCVQAIGDGGGDQLAPGEPCSALTSQCAPPVACSFDAYGFDAICSLYSANLDSGDGPYHCCQYAKTRSMVDGHVIQYRDCGEGLTCVAGC